MGMRKHLRVWLFLAIGAANLWRGWMAFHLWPSLREWPMPVDLRVVGTLYLLWGLLFLGGAWLLRRDEGRSFAWPLALAYEGFVWTLALLTESNRYQQQVRPRDVLLSVLFLAAVAFLVPPFGTTAPSAHTQGGSDDDRTATMDAG